jgi:hypothetical protein
LTIRDARRRRRQEHGHTVRLTIRADGKGRVHFPDDVMRIDLLRHSPQGWANVELIPA